MFDFIINWFRRRRLKRDASDVPTCILPLRKVGYANVVIDAQERDFDRLKEDILAWGRANGVKISIFFIDLRKLSKGELLLTSIQTTIIRKELSWYGAPPLEKARLLMDDSADLFISMIDSSDFLVDYLCKCSHARFKVGRKAYPGHAFDMIVTNNASGNLRNELRTDSREVFALMTDYLNKIQ